MSEPRRELKRRYRPKVEALEALRLLSDGVLPTLAPSVVDSWSTIAPVLVPETSQPISGDTWDTALAQTEVSRLLGPTQATDADPALVANGISQLNRYLARSWGRAGLPPQVYDDCTQAVYTTLLQNLGRDGFDHLAADVGENGIPDVLSRETPDGPDFFRAVDMVKKRAQRERSYQALDDYSDVAGTDGAATDWQSALNEAIATRLNPREAALIHDTLQGKTPAEIAHAWGVAPKTVSNEKTRALAKLRDALSADVGD